MTAVDCNQRAAQSLVAAAEAVNLQSIQPWLSQRVDDPLITAELRVSKGARQRHPGARVCDRLHPACRCGAADGAASPPARLSERRSARLRQRVDHPQRRETPEIAVCGPEFAHAVLKAQRRDVRFMHCRAGDAAFLQQRPQGRPVAFGRGQQNQARAFKPGFVKGRILAVCTDQDVGSDGDDAPWS